MITLKNFYLAIIAQAILTSNAGEMIYAASKTNKGQVSRLCKEFATNQDEKGNNSLEKCHEVNNSQEV
jgi:hypothetical protein